MFIQTDPPKSGYFEIFTRANGVEEGTADFPTADDATVTTCSKTF